MFAVPMEDTVESDHSPEFMRYRDEFRASVDKDRDWRVEAREDIEFFCGKQWDDRDRQILNEQGRPTLTINRIKPLINLLSGYQRLNRFEPEFLPRTKNDIDLCSVRKGVTKYIMDQCDYASVESAVFLDGSICGRGWFEVCYDWDYASLDGDIKIKRVSPMDIYPDPESVAPDYSDAKFLFRCKWADKDELKAVYPQHADIIDFTTNEYDRAEDITLVGLEPLWYQKNTHKLRLVERWGRRTESQQYYLVVIDGKESLLKKEEITVDHFVSGQVKRPVSLPITKTYCTVFIGEHVLEEKESPYEHGMFPYVPFIAYYLGEGDIPAGVVRDIKDPQREVNKRRSQSLHILGTQANSGWIHEEGVFDAKQKSNVRKFGSMPGVMIETKPGMMTKLQRINPPNPPVGLFQAEQEAVQDIRDISGINEGMLGTDISQSASGKAIELRQRQAVTHIGALFDNLRRAKQQILFIMWGKRGKKGLVQQYYTDEKTFRIVGDNGEQDFITINQRVQVEDPILGVIHKTLNDLSVGEFDIVVSDTPSTATQRQSQFWALVDAISKLGIPGDMVFDMLIDMSDIPNREEIKKRWMERQQAQQEAGQQTPIKLTGNINIKDIPPEAQAQMLARIGIELPIQQQNPFVPVLQQLPPQVIMAISQMGPQELYGAIKMLFGQMPPEIQAQVGQMIQGIPPEQVIQMFHDAAVQVSSAAGGSQPQVPQQVQQRPNPQTMTQPAVREMLSAAQIGM
ncbi:hypothetical protein EV210_101157 [Anaerospora hongkongensis]|uniref:Phage P22-like portal protein n=1 Tax=Anaerospora hongkongensis TaxID=244830 RepID=A0A4R1Q1W1_9FIRM|nr:hypothetical protein EV210_101157 [Anaerospora hongkongensis]